MSVKASVSITDQQDEFARGLVAQGHYSSLSAVVQQGIELLREQTEAREVETAALRALFEERRKGPFVDVEESRRRTSSMLSAKKAELGL